MATTSLLLVLNDELGRLLGVRLAGTAARPLAGHDRAAQQQLAAPDSPRLTPLEGALESGRADPAVLAERLGRLHVGGCLGEKQLRVVRARQGGARRGG